MSVVEQFLIELKEAKIFEDQRILGYEEFLSFPSNLLSPEARAEIAEAHTWSVHRSILIAQTIVTVEALLSDSYPIRLQQIAAEIVIKELKLRLFELQLAVDEFETPPVGSSTVSEEISI